jgi:hypothetical protein
VRDTSFGVDKHLKFDKPLGTVWMSTEAHPIKVVNTTPSKNMRADEIAIKTAKTGKVHVVVAVMSIFIERNASRGVLILETRSFLVKNRERSDFLGGNFRKPRNLAQKLI